jgi:hypothetical protein
MFDMARGTRVGHAFAFETRVAQELHGALIGNVGSRRFRSTAMPGDHQIGDVVLA